MAMTNSLLVMAGGALGALLRYQFSRLVGMAMGIAFPWGTLFINILGGFAMGLLAGTLARWSPSGAPGGEQYRLLLGVGVLGGFTTFSAFSLETVVLIERGDAMQAVAYVAASVIGAVAAVALGLAAVRSLA
jgi:CrcB protein